MRAELYTAAMLLREERFTLDYERYGAMKQRGPDFTITFKTHTPFNVEVRRIRSVDWDDSAEHRMSKLVLILCEKVRQIPPGIVNVLWLTSERAMSEAELLIVNVSLRQAAELKRGTFFTRQGFESAADFLKAYRQLSGIGLAARSTRTLWLNNTARHPVSPDIAKALQRIIALPD
ncbi:hypothetical protein HC776_01925 [bacterium]|nr:hypothetical protein [bacterium]